MKREITRHVATLMAVLGMVLAAPSCVAPEGAHCETRTTCGSCTSAGSGCGWCGGACLDGTSLGPTSGTCDGERWTFDRCSDDDTPTPSPTTAPPRETDASFVAPTDLSPDGDGGDAGYEGDSSVDCSSYSDCFSCALAGCGFCGDFGTCSDVQSAVDTCSSLPTTSPDACN